MNDWAVEKAKAWLSRKLDRWTPMEDLVSLAALLREVECHKCTEHQLRTEKSLLAEVRRVVEETAGKPQRGAAAWCNGWMACGRKILARLEKL